MYFVLIRERLYIQCYVLNILSPEFPFLTVWLHLVIICILLKESVVHQPLWRHYLISPPCGPLGEIGSGTLGKRKQKSGFSLRHATQAWALVQKWTCTPEWVHCGAPEPGKLSGRQPLYFTASPVSEPHRRCKLTSGGSSVLRLSIPHNFFNSPAYPKSF